MIDTYHTRQSRKCKYCEKDAKRNIRPDGRNKGFYETCGSRECVKQNYKDKAVNARRHSNIEKVCEKCGKEYTSVSPRQKWCTECVPDKNARAIIQRYGLSHPEHTALIVSSDGKCQICEKRKATVVDHDHRTGKIRGVLCNGCNVTLHLVENEEMLERAKNYLKQNAI